MKYRFVILVIGFFLTNSGIAEPQQLNANVKLKGYVHQELISSLVDVCYAGSDVEVQKIDFGCGCLYAKFSDDLNETVGDEKLIRVNFGVKTLNSIGSRSFETYVYLTDGEILKLNVNYEILPVLKTASAYIRIPNDVPERGIRIVYTNLYNQSIESFELARETPDLDIATSVSDGKALVTLKLRDASKFSFGKLGYLVLKVNFEDGTSYRTFLYYK